MSKPWSRLIKSYLDKGEIGGRLISGSWFYEIKVGREYLLIRENGSLFQPPRPFKYYEELGTLLSEKPFEYNKRLPDRRTTWRLYLLKRKLLGSDCSIH